MIGVDSAFTHLGGDSITAMQVVSRCRARHLTGTTVSDILRYQTIRKIAEQARRNYKGPPWMRIAREDEQGNSFDLSPIQKMHFQAHPDGVDHYNQSFLLKLRNQVDWDNVRDALRMVVIRHPMLRAKFIKEGDKKSWKQRIAHDTPSSFQFSYRRVETRKDIQDIIYCDQRSLDISRGPVFSAIIFDVQSDNSQVLFLSGYHLVIDFVSWRILWHELEQHINGDPPPVSGSLSFRAWCKIQKESTSQLCSEGALPITLAPSSADYWGLPPEQNTYGDRLSHHYLIDPETSALLAGSSNEALQTNVVDILVAVLLCSFRNCFQERHAPAIFLETHGRELLAYNDYEIDPADTVGLRRYILFR